MYNRDTLPFPENRVPRLTSEGMRDWDELDPARHPFAWDGAEEARLRLLVGAWVPPVPSGRAGWWEGERWCERQVDGVIRERYGAWAWGWSWSHHDGGPIGSWVGAKSVTTPDATAARVVAALLEWRQWLERAARRFAELAPPPDAAPEDRGRHLERACARLVTFALGTGSEGGWYGKASMVLCWYLITTGMDRAEAVRAVDGAIGGRFESWTVPQRKLIASVGKDLAAGVTGRAPYRDDRDRQAPGDLHGHD
ncbi:hypothetical protein GA0115240_11615 [Streptomyces sp. DvalAA-14]|uniref:hypothetical protein n=1 Tax=unclassified Streptomyces TaxID=2593676 RepID=UPI00081B94A4|nr:MULTISPECIES: hypothetical protein [unclassified Streptomyces]SCD59887.1 hypothetical protein GA0115240_11615 [Streptomyces sp. DvalAA-14]